MKTITTELDTSTRGLRLKAQHLTPIANALQAATDARATIGGGVYDSIARIAGVPGKEFTFRGVVFRRGL